MDQHLMSNRNGVQNRETFHKFFESWLVEQNQDLDQLVRASKDVNAIEENNRRMLLPLIQRVIHHYENYYKEKSTSAKEDVLGMLNPTWRSNLEDAFLWIGGWRPSMAFHLLYSKSGLQLEAGFHDLFRGISTGDLGDLSGIQLGKIDELQNKTLREEKKLSERLAKVQETIADTSMVELSHIVSEILREEGRQVEENEEEKVKNNIAKKEENLLEVLKKADDLRLRTLKDILGILKPIQAVHFLIAAAELHLRIHEWGMKKDIAAVNSHNHGHGVVNNNRDGVRI
ncbi:PREDICTED: protein DELAY OF GERMINATION 1-like [Nicotiana attenuata]|uniref:Transcription factor hbp-1b(C1) n=1 Tax=Nicotiana attenuata TaxID=49451 RepID=A0A1J6JX55_NICAT|nr:PREDICTED: protein DELAY OF GERMINATION 1-like [Nicotiana attenuata]XP_019238491.1 PREDICTED: protein DELAY OF GERMINATION 1-like [Nicotiana attenuata]OIT21702.1 transcription factor hbp-1b(c1) [Nicotiana attenuata]